MSTVQAVNFKHPSATTAAITLDSTGAMTGSFPYPNRNLLYNGAMQVAQRSASVAGITTSGYYTADRWQFPMSALGTWTQTIENDAPTGSGFSKSLKVLCTTADASPTTGDYVIVNQKLEGQDVQRIAKGTASAQQLTLSFWVKSNVMGTFIIEIFDTDNNRHVSAPYTISSSATWQKVAVTIPSDSTGILNNDNGGSLEINFWLASGPEYSSGSSLTTSWISYTANRRAVGQTNLASSTNNYWQITGVQLETGPVATPFEFKSYAQELRECQRYYQKFAGGQPYSGYGLGMAQSTTLVYTQINHKTTMRTTPTSIEASGLFVNDWITGLTPSAISLSTINSGNDVSLIQSTVTGATAYRTYALINANNSAGYLALSAEL